MTDATAIPVNVFENDRELMVVAPMPGVAPEDISIDVTDDGHLTLRARDARRGPGADRVPHAGVVVRSVRADDRAAVRRRRDARQSSPTGTASSRSPSRRPASTAPGRVLVQRTGHARGIAAGHAGTRGGDDEPESRLA